MLFEVIFIHFSVNKVSSLGVHFEDNLLLNCKRLSLGRKLLSSRYLFKCNSYCLTSESSAHTSIALSCFGLLLHLFQVTQGGLGMNCRCCVLPDTELISGTRFNTLVEALLNGRGLTLWPHYLLWLTAVKKERDDVTLPTRLCERTSKMSCVCVPVYVCAYV